MKRWALLILLLAIAAATLAWTDRSAWYGARWSGGWPDETAAPAAGGADKIVVGVGNDYVVVGAGNDYVTVN